MRVFHRLTTTCLVGASLAGCAFHSTATHWNGHVGSDGEPVFVQQSTYLGFHLFAMLPFVGATTIDEMVDEATGQVPGESGARMRLLETETNNYWYGVPPLTWFVSPVVTSVSIEYRPSPAALARAGRSATGGELPSTPR